MQINLIIYIFYSFDTFSLCSVGTLSARLGFERKNKVHI